MTTTTKKNSRRLKILGQETLELEILGQGTLELKILGHKNAQINLTFTVHLSDCRAIHLLEIWLPFRTLGYDHTLIYSPGTSFPKIKQFVAKKISTTEISRPATKNTICAATPTTTITFHPTIVQELGASVHSD